jgi:hypothetical protein
MGLSRDIARGKEWAHGQYPDDRNEVPHSGKYPIVGYELIARLGWEN